MTQESRQSVRRAMTRVPAFMAQIIAISLVLGDITLLSGVVERRVIPVLSQHLIGARAYCWIDGWKPLYLRGLRIQDGKAAPLLDIDMLAVHWQAAFDRIDMLDLRGVKANFDGSDPHHPNYAFLLPYLRDAGDSTGREPSVRLPKRVAASGVHLSADMPNWAAAVSGLNINANITDKNNIIASLSGDAVRTGWQSEQKRRAIPLSVGQVDATLAVSPERFEMRTRVRLPDFMEVEGTAFYLPGATGQLEVNMTEMQLNGPVFGALAALYSPLAVSFDAVDVSPMQLHAIIADGAPILKEAKLDAHVKNLVIGADNAPWYAGDVHIEASGGGGAESQALWAATLHKKQRISGTITSGNNGILFSSTIYDWSGEQLTSLWPAPFAQWAPYLPIVGGISGGASGGIQDGKVAFEGDFSLVLDSESTANIQINGSHDIQEEQAAAQCAIALGGGTATINATYEKGMAAAVIAAESMPASDIFGLLPWRALDGLHAKITGTATMQQGQDGSYMFDVSADAALPGYYAWSLPGTLSPVNVAGNVALSGDFSAITAEGLLRLPDDGAVVNIDNLRYDIGRQHVSSSFSGAGALMYLGAAFGYDDLWGEATFEGGFSLQDWTSGEIKPLHISFEPLGYGDLSTPYGEALVIDAPVRFTVEPLRLETGAAHVAMGEGTYLSTDGLIIEPDGVSAESPIVFETDFSPVVAKQYISAATGRATVSVEGFRFDGSGLAGEIIYDFDASRMNLPNKLADMRGVKARGRVALHPTPAGEGALEIEEIKAGGTTLRKSTAVIRVDGDTLVIDDAMIELFGGGVIGRAEARPFEPGMPIVVTGDVNDIDLSIFTNEFEPPSLLLTGRVNGRMAAGLTSRQLAMLDIDLEAYKDFSMNRDMVEQLLMSQYVGEIAGGRQMTRMLASVIGDDDQRKFDRARLTLGLEDKRIAGAAKLESKTLDLTVDIKADPLALIEALRARQQ